MSNVHFFLTFLIMVASTLYTAMLHPLLVVLSLFRVRAYFLSTRSHMQKLNRVLNNIVSSSAYVSSMTTFRNDERIPAGLVLSLSPFFVARIQYFSKWERKDLEHIYIYVLCRQNVFEQLIDDQQNKSKTKNNDSPKTLAFAARSSTGEEEAGVSTTPPSFSFLQPANAVYTGGDFVKKTCSEPHLLDERLPCVSEQNNAVRTILHLWKRCQSRRQNTTMTALVSGPRGCGKSFLGDILAAKLSGTVCYDYNPTVAGSMLSKVMQAASPSKQHPLIIVINEYDRLLTSSHNGTVPLAKAVRTEVTDAVSHNNWLDKIDRGVEIYHTIVLLTTNVPIHQLDDLNPAYTRMGRVHLKLTMSGHADQLLKAAMESRMGSA